MGQLHLAARSLGVRVAPRLGGSGPAGQPGVGGCPTLTPRVGPGSAYYGQPGHEKRNFTQPAGERITNQQESRSWISLVHKEYLATVLFVWHLLNYFKTSA